MPSHALKGLNQYSGLYRNKRYLAKGGGDASTEVVILLTLRAPES
jgi:hypothetical protein